MTKYKLKKGLSIIEIVATIVITIILMYYVSHFLIWFYDILYFYITTIKF